MPLQLAAIPLDRNGAHSVLLWSVVLIGLILLAFAGYSLFKRWMTDAQETTRAAGFTLGDLRALRDQGQMSSEEYELARAKMVAAAKRMTETMPDIVPRRTTGTSKDEIRMTNQGRNSKEE